MDFWYHEGENTRASNVRLKKWCVNLSGADYDTGLCVQRSYIIHVGGHEKYLRSTCKWCVGQRFRIELPIVSFPYWEMAIHTTLIQLWGVNLMLALCLLASRIPTKFKRHGGVHLWKEKKFIPVHWC
jgi:hypothetical protein